MNRSLISLMAELENWFQSNGLKLPTIISLPDRETGMKFSYVAAKEIGINPIISPEASWVEIRGIRFIWPMSRVINMTINQLREKLDERMVEANQDAWDSNKTAHNSYGADYDAGLRDALQTVLNTINGEEDNTL